jgi:hypothetical protein
MNKATLRWASRASWPLRATRPALALAAVILLSSGDAAAQAVNSCGVDPVFGVPWTKCTQTGTPTCVSSDWSVVATLAGPTQNTCTFYVTGPVYFSLPLVRWTSNPNVLSKCNAALGANVIVSGTTRLTSCIADDGSSPPTTSGSSFTYGKNSAACK